MTLLVGSSSSFSPPASAAVSPLSHQQPGRYHTTAANKHKQRCPNNTKQHMAMSSNEDSTSIMNKVLTWVVFSDVGSLVLGSVGLVALLVGRLLLNSNDGNALPDPAETRENLLIAMAIGGVLLNGLTQLDVESVKATPVQLDGVLVEVDDDEYAWVLRSIVSSLEAVRSAVVLERDETTHNWTVSSRHGVVPTMMTTSVASNSNTPLLDKAATIVGTKDGSETTTSLPNLQALPGWKQELLINGKLLPSNTPATLLVPVISEGRQDRLLVLGSDRARSFTPKDIAWCRAVAGRLQ